MASKTSVTWQRRMFTFVLPAQDLPTTTRSRKTNWSCAADWTNACQSCGIKNSCTTGKERRMTSMEGTSTFLRRCSAGSTNIQKRCVCSASGRASLRHDQGPDGSNPLPDEDAARVAAEMALHVLAYNLTRVMNIMGTKPLMAAIRA